jgi:4-hydroxybenzoate polyprenyltransferase
MRPGTLVAIWRTARPRQWVKNLLVAAPLVYARHLGDGGTVIRAALAFIIFCALSSAVYFWNDVIDIEKDRAHPKKRNRPIAAGLLPIPLAKTIAGVLAVGGLLAAVFLSVPFAACALAYLVKQVAYSLKLKHIVYVDVVVIALGFILRTLAGALAISVYASPYLIVCTGLVALFFGFGKRYHELEASGAAVAQRTTLAAYRADALTAALWISGGATLLAYFLYTRALHTLIFFGTERMVFTVPFVGFGLIRFVQILRQRRGDSPTDEMLHDVLFMTNFALFAATAIFVIYWSRA